MAVILRLVIVMLGIAGAAGTIVFEGTMQSDILRTNRFIRVYLPPSYDEFKSTRFPVLYVHDGQNAFSTAGPHAAFGWGNWELDKTADRLIAEKKICPIIIVAIDCSASRYREYRGPIAPGADNRAYERYARFLVEELKPRIDRDYRTLRGPEHTGLLGSSMGGICSLALAWEHPDTFGLAASLSGAFQVEKQHFVENVIGSPIAKKKPIRIYLDSGTGDYSGGDDGLKHTEAVAMQLQRLRWKPGTNLLHHIDRPLNAEQLKPFDLPNDKFSEAQRSQHNELYWRLRAWRPLTFLFPPE
ncbi:MAG: alpha/beta hydrolase [Limisphaerales bacterium]